MSLSHVDALFFDVFGTVVNWLDTVTSEVKSTIVASPHPDGAVQRQLLEHDWEGFTKEWRKGYLKGTRELSQTGNPEKITVDEMHRKILGQLVQGVPNLSEAWIPERGNEEVLDRLNMVWHRLRGWEDTTQGLEELKRQFKVGTLTNGNLALMIDVAKSADLPWDFILTADLLGSFKPDDKMYKQAMELVGLDSAVHARRACMVAAHLYDLEAAKKCGMSTVFVKRRTEDQLKAGEATPEYVDLVVEDLLDLAKQAGGLPMA